ncbi:MAG: DUF452 family protein [Bacteroidota bacterium]|nr:DUF452 family protein [Bacteroidota bacterium]
MTHTWITKTSECKLILFFNGLGMDENTLCGFNNAGYDVCMFYNYNELTSLKESFDEYDEIYVVAWSMGVWVAEQVLKISELRITKSVAINGTLLPISSEFGIAKNIFKGTAKNWDERNRKKFFMRMFASKNLFEKYNNSLPKRDTAEQKEELLFLAEEASKCNRLGFNWDMAFCGEQDLIFSYKNQINHWQNRTEVISLNMPHFPFGMMKCWDEILKW